jgi:hypothetical protein
MLGSWVRAPGGSRKTKEKIKQIPDNQVLSGISFFWQIAGNRVTLFSWVFTARKTGEIGGLCFGPILNSKRKPLHCD